MSTQSLLVRSPFGHPFDRLVSELFAPSPSACAASANQFEPAADVSSDAAGYVIELDVPGFKMDQVEVTALGRELTIKGRRELAVREGATAHLRERVGGAFERVVRLPADARLEDVKASLRDGVLTVRVPRAEAAQPRRIVVQPSEN